MSATTTSAAEIAIAAMTGVITSALADRNPNIVVTRDRQPLDTVLVDLGDPGQVFLITVTAELR
ncbi:hypothetical protein ACSMXN_05680 [Jatrophihabitans sp. DSM 45814]